MTEIIWYRDVRALLEPSSFLEYPFSTSVRTMNFFFRFVIVLSFLYMVIRRQVVAPFLLVIVSGVLTYVVHEHSKRRVQDDTIDTPPGIKTNARHLKTLLEKEQVEPRVISVDPLFKKACQRPSLNNPFMNVLVSDYKFLPNRPPACPLSKTVVNEMKANFDVGLYRDADDIFHKSASDRQFYTMPSTTIPNDKKAFNMWLFDKVSAFDKKMPKATLYNSRFHK